MGGIHKWKPTRLDLLLRDAACAGADRAKNARKHRTECPDSVAADLAQLAALAAQSRRVAATALGDGDLGAGDKARIDRWLNRIDAKLAEGQDPARPVPCHVPPSRTLARLMS